MNAAARAVADRPSLLYVVDSAGFLAPTNGGEVKRRSLVSALAAVGDVTVKVVPVAGREHQREPVMVPTTLNAAVEVLQPFPGDVRSASPVSRIGYLARPRVAKRMRSCRLFGASFPVPDVVVVDAPHLLVTVGQWNVPTIVVTQNRESLTYARLAKARGTKLHRRGAYLFAAVETRLLERRASKRCAQWWVVSDEDRDGYRRQFRNVDIRVAPNVIESVPPSVGAPDTSPPVIGFLGSLGYGPNRAAAIQFANVVQRLRADGLVFRAVVVGGGADTELSSILAAADVAAPGFVEHLDPVLSPLSALVAPLTSGGGTKLKTLEALARGLPLITTDEGVRGLTGGPDGLQLGAHALVRPVGPQFDQAVREVLQGPEAARSVGTKGREWVLRSYGPDVLARVVADHLRDLLGGAEA